MKLISILVLFLAASCAGLAGSASENERYIQGKWRLSGELKEPDGTTRAWFLEWSFDNGRFTQGGYPPIKQKGKYRILEDKADAITLELHDQSGTFGEEDRQLKIVIDRENSKLKISGKDGFQKINSENKSG